MMISIQWTTLLMLLDLSATQECSRFLEKNSINECRELIVECVLDEGAAQFEYCRDDVLETLSQP